MSLFVLTAFWISGDGINQIQLIPIRGEISAFGTASSQQIVQEIKDADENPMVRAIIVELNTPGGSVVASQEIAQALENTKKPTVAWMREVAASGGYWIATSTDFIIADPATITGSIGVTASYLQFSDLMEKYGVTYEQIKAGKYKETGSPYTDLSTDERAILQSKVNLIRDMFISHISKTRKMTWEQADKLATGEIFLGIEAKQLGLVDELGGKDLAFVTAKKLAGISSANLNEPSPTISSFLQDLLQSKATTTLPNSIYAALLLENPKSINTQA